MINDLFIAALLTLVVGVPAGATPLPTPESVSLLNLDLAVTNRPPERSDPPAPPQLAAVNPPERPPPFRFFWNQGPCYEHVQQINWQGAFTFLSFPENRSLSGRVNLKLHLDAAAFKESGGRADAENGFLLRRARLNTVGRTYFLRPVEYQVEFEITDWNFYFLDGYVWWFELPWVRTLKAGIMTAPFGMESIESSSRLRFMETASPIQAFSPGHKFGLQVGGPLLEDRMTLYGGWYADASKLDTGDASDSLARFIARCSALPVRRGRDQDRLLVHLGLSADYMISEGDTIRYQSRPESRLAPMLVDTGPLPGEQAFLSGLEVGVVRGSHALQAEWIGSQVRHSDTGEAFFQGGYLHASWILTGESLRYDRRKGVFDGVDPSAPFSWKHRRWGALEAGLRASYLDLEHGLVQGGRMQILTAGLNWYWTRKTRMVLNVLHAEVDGGLQDGRLNIVQTRFQWDI